jgi:hypothetical protein
MAKKGGAGAPEDWIRMADIEENCAELVAAYHPHLKNARILVFGKPRSGRSKGGQLALGKPLRATALLRAALRHGGSGHAADYVIVIGLDTWNPLEWKHKEALLDHWLSHFAGMNENGRFAMTGPDIVEFVSVYERRGPYNYTLQRMQKVAADIVQLEIEGQGFGYPRAVPNPTQQAASATGP